MARRLSFHQITLGLALAATAANFSAANAHPTSQEPATSTPTQPAQTQPQSTVGAPREEAVAQDQRPDDKRGDDKRSDDKRSDDKRGDNRHDDRRDGERHDGERRDGDRRMGGRGLKDNPGFVLEIVKRDGGSLELLSPLMKPEVRELLGLDAQHAAAVDQFMADMSTRMEQEFKAFKNQPNGNWDELFKKRLEFENKEFDALLKTLPPEKLDRLIGIFVQYRNLRALGNRVVAVEKLGMPVDKFEKLRGDIHRIRREVTSESDDILRRNAESGNTVQASDHLRKIRKKIDVRIEKLIEKEYVDQDYLGKLKSLRGQELATALLESLDRLGPPKKQ